MKTISKLLLAIALFTFLSCKKLLEVDAPKTSVSSGNVYERDATAAAVLTGLYSKLSSDNLTGGMPPSVTILSGLSGDEFKVNAAQGNQKLNAYYANSLQSNIAGYEFWDSIYPDLFVVNAALEGVAKSNSLSSKVKQQALGEARFMRAFYLFYLVNLYGDVPLTISTDYKVNAVMPRTNKDAVWKQIIDDLKEAKNLLDNKYLDASLIVQTPEKVRPNKIAATALLARAYLYTGDWQNAEIQATNVIDNQSYRLVSLDETFKKNSDEAIWQLQPVLQNYTTEATLFVIDTSTPNGGISARPVFLNPTVKNDFDEGDQRKVHWIGSVNVNGIDYDFPYKYKIRPAPIPDVSAQEYSTVLRLAELYLIRAEARIHLNEIAQGITDLNILRTRATDKAFGSVQLRQLPDNLDAGEALLAVEHERRTELFAEWGHRWLDLKRTGRIDAVMTIAASKKTSENPWNSFKQFYPINFIEFKTNPLLVQTAGY